MGTFAVKTAESTVIDKRDLVTKVYESTVFASTVEDDGGYILQRISDIFGESGLIYWVSAGTALGLLRDGQLIPHDTDIDIEFIFNWNEYAEREQTVIDRMEQNEFELIRTIHYQGRPMQLAFIHRLTGIIVDFYIYYGYGNRIKNLTTVGVMEIPISFVINRLLLYFYERLIYFPNPPIEYLELRFGEHWHKPHTRKGVWTEDANNLISIEKVSSL